MATTKISAKTVEVPKTIIKEFPAEKSSSSSSSSSTSETTTMQVDAAEIVYGKAKDIFGWSKSLPVMSFLAGVSEAVAGKALDVVGLDLPTVDSSIESELTKFDAHILNPAITQIFKVLTNVASTSEEIVKPIIINLISPFGLIKSEANESTPEVTATKN